MHFIRFFPSASALILSLSTVSQARVANIWPASPNGRAVDNRASGQSNSEEHVLHGVFGKREINQICNEDEYLDSLQSLSPAAQQTFCNIWIDIPPATTEVQTTPARYGSPILTCLSMSSLTLLAQSLESRPPPLLSRVLVQPGKQARVPSFRQPQQRLTCGRENCLDQILLVEQQT